MTKHRILLGGVMLVGLGLVAVGAVASTSSQPEPFTDQACLDCHSDQARLMELAVVEEEEPEAALSSGPG
jgi:hypothetical protein